MSIQDRLRTYIDCKKLNYRDFERLCKLGNGTAASISEKTRHTTFNRISIACPDLNIEWLKTGKGPMIVETTPAAVAAMAAPAAESSAITEVAYIPVSAHASFIENLLIPSEPLDTYPVVLTASERAEIDKYKIFEVDGDSMFPSIKDGDLILAKEVPERTWHYAEGVVVIIFAEYVVVKRIAHNELISSNTLILSSDNPAYGSMTVPLSDIRAIYKARRIVSSEIK